MKISAGLIIAIILGVLVPGLLALGSIVLLVVKIIERKKEKKKEDWDKYKNY
ncbi:hypothetical protein [Romboutsia lituseburensis]|uniref:hypothetical protein n=1 Tax=Romboutsia lituseburensis TaxID=1537 RepID=UPI00215A9E9C|nr:hypothetical protein [Romboutsia lituseburensis]MCR8744923.1 hypothetical protein [Romboutsia lituseburensis]